MAEPKKVERKFMNNVHWNRGTKGKEDGFMKIGMNKWNSQIQCDAIKWEQYLRRCRLGQLYNGIQ